MGGFEQVLKSVVFCRLISEKRGSCKRAAFHCLINAPQNFLHVGTPFTSCLADPRASSVIFCLQQRVNS